MGGETLQALLGRLNAVDGVVGSFVCDAGGRLLAQAFPPVFETRLLERAAGAVAQGAAGLGSVTGGVGLLDFRFGESRVLVRPVRGGSLVFLCTPAVDPQPLAICAAAALPRLESLVAAAS